MKAIYAILIGLGSLLGTAHAVNLIDSVIIDNNKITVTANQDFHNKYLKNNFFAEYEETINLATVDPTIALIPFITSVIPIVWASNKTYTIDAMDKDLYEALDTLSTIFKKFYPSQQWEGKLIPKKLIVNTVTPQKNTIAVLFSHGLDAVYTSFNNRNKHQVLITIGGGDIRLSQKAMWENVKEQSKKFSLIHGHTNAFVRSNFLSFLNIPYLCTLSPEIKNWFGDTSQSLIYTGIAAPLAYLNGCSQLLIASTRTSDNPFPYGTHPVIDNTIKFAGISVDHDGPEVHRLEKIRQIAQISTTAKLPKPFLRVCWGKDPNGGNCNHCEKCLRTMVELMIEEQTPSDYGFNVSQEEAINIALTESPGSTKLKPGIIWHWNCIKNTAQQKLAQNKNTYKNHHLQKFIDWLLSTNFDSYKFSYYKNPPEQEKERFMQLWKKATRRALAPSDFL